MRKRTMVQVDGRTAYVAGAAAGSGRAMALRLAAHGCPVAIVDQGRENACFVDARGPQLCGQFMARASLFRQLPQYRHGHAQRPF